jgi:hypothetical protein
VAEPKLERLTRGIDVGPTVEGAQDGPPGGLVELLDLPVTFGITPLAIHEGDAEPATHFGNGPVDEARSVVEVQNPHATVGPEHAVESREKKLSRLRGADDRMEPVARGVVEEEVGDATKPLRTRPEVLSSPSASTISMRCA